MEIKPVLKEHPMHANPYLSFSGNCEAAFKFYAQCLGGKIDALLTHAGSPMEAHVSPEWLPKIMHAHLTVGDWSLMGSDCPPEQYQTPQGFSVMLNLDDRSEAERIFAALAENGTVQMPLQSTFWADRFGTLVDQFGTPWMINSGEPAAA